MMSIGWWMKTCISQTKNAKHLFIYPVTIKFSVLKFKVLVLVLEYTIIWRIHDGEPVLSKRCTMGPSK